MTPYRRTVLQLYQRRALMDNTIKDQENQKKMDVFHDALFGQLVTLQLLDVKPTGG